MKPGIRRLSDDDRAADLSSLARALVALTCARANVTIEKEKLEKRFEDAIVRLEEADREYRAEIERVLPRGRAGEMLSAMTAFRREVAAIREQARAALPYGDFDPLDTHVPSFPGSHADAVRAANFADGARQAVADARAVVNARVSALLEPDQLERLRRAKAVRDATFERAIREAAPSEVSDRLAVQLALLAQNWF